MRKIALINASPKASGSASALLLNELQSHLSGQLTPLRIPLRTDLEALSCLQGQDALVFALPLYVDGLPSHLVRCLTELEPRLRGETATVYGIVNCGFFEGRQNRIALELLQNWCTQTGLRWGAGLGVGGGGMLSALTGVPAGHGPRKNVSEALTALAADLSALRQAENRFVSPNFPRRLYILIAQASWRKQLVRNGGKRRDLARRLWPE